MAELRKVTAYSQALFDVASELGREDEILKDAKDLVSVFASETGLCNVLETPAVSKTEKKQLLKNIFEGHVEKEVLNLLFILIDRNSFSLFPRIVSEFEKTREREKGVIKGEIVSARPLSEDRIDRLEKETAKLLGVKNVKLANTVDSDIIGGIKIFADGRLVDASIKTKLNELAECLVY